MNNQTKQPHFFGPPCMKLLRWLQSSTSANSRNYPADTAKQRFMEEVYNKETAIRLGWHFSPTGRQLSKDSMTSRRKEV